MGGHKQCLQIYEELSNRIEIILVYIILKDRITHCFQNEYQVLNYDLHDWYCMIGFILFLSAHCLPLLLAHCSPVTWASLRLLVYTRYISTSGSFYLFPLPPWTTLPQNICTFQLFRSYLKCHLLREIFPDQPI